MLSRPEQRDFIDEGSCDGQQRSLSHCEYTYTCFILLIDLTILTVFILFIMLEMSKYFSAKLIGIMVLIALPVCPPFITLHVRGMEAGETGERINELTNTISFCPSLKNQPHIRNMVAVLNNQRQYWVEQARQGQD